MRTQPNWEWVPGVSIGPICFGDRAERFLQLLDLEEQERDFDGTDEWVRYWSRSGDLSILTVNGHVTSVSCDETCVYRGTNLIGLPEKQLRGALADARCELADDPIGYSLEFEDLGLDARIREGRVASVTVSVDPDTVLQ